MLPGARARLAAINALLIAAACTADTGSDADASDPDATAATIVGESSGSDSAQGCAAEQRDDDYMLGLERSGERVLVRFVDAMPSPPARFDNTWMLEIVDASSGTPIEDVSLEVEPFMPDHNHGTSIACHVSPTATPGHFELDPVNLFMPGLWEIRLHFVLPDESTDEVVFRFCVDP